MRRGVRCTKKIKVEIDEANAKSRAKEVELKEKELKLIAMSCTKYNVIISKDVR
jgi:hypothetical protein